MILELAVRPLSYHQDKDRRTALYHNMLRLKMGVWEADDNISPVQSLKNVSHRVWEELIIYIFYMTSRAICQNIFPEVIGQPSGVMSPDAEGRGWYNILGLSCHGGENILVKSAEKPCSICKITFSNKKMYPWDHDKVYKNRGDNHGIPFVSVTFEISCDFLNFR
jgi:hypothetical protein